MFRTTLVNLTPDATQAIPDLGLHALGSLPADEVRRLLDRFALLDPLDNAKADPEIIFETRRAKKGVRTGQGRLYLYDPRDVLEPALVLSVHEIMAELDGSAAAARTRPPFALPAELAPDTLPVELTPKPRTTLRPPHRIALGAVSLCCSIYLGYATLAAETAPGADAFDPITDPVEQDGYRNDFAGVYMTGPQPGDHGIALCTDGTIRLFQLNAQGAPSFLTGTYTIGRVNGQLGACSAHSSLPLRFTGRTALLFGGETYQRLP